MAQLLILICLQFPLFAFADLNPEILGFLDEMKSERIVLPERDPLYNHYYKSSKEQPDALVIVPGMGESALKYYEIAKDLKAIPATIYVWDHIGQGTSYHFLPEEKKKIHIDSFDTHMAALEHFLSDIRKTHKKIYLVGHSMGGHIALRILVHNPTLIDRVVITAPMLDFNRSKAPVHLIAWLLHYLPATYYPSLFTLFKSSKNADIFVTKSEERIKIRKQIIEVFPDLERVGPTMGWLDEAVKSMEHFGKEDFSKIKAPMLILQADDDALVSSSAQEAFCKKVPSCKLEVIKNSRHEILFEIDEVRKDALARIIPFIRGTTPQ
jgi:lysophospholipase